MAYEMLEQNKPGMDRGKTTPSITDCFYGTCLRKDCAGCEYQGMSENKKLTLLPPLYVAGECVKR